MQDRKLLKKLKQDPERGMRELIERYSGLVYAVVRGRLFPGAFDIADVDECVADTFSEFYMDLDKFDPDRAGIKAWLCAIARHNSLDRVRKQRSLSVSSLDDPNIPDIEDDFSLEGEFIEKAERKRVLDAVKALGEPDREIIIRKYYLGQSSKTIAQRLDMTVSNVDVRTHRAVARLKDSIGGE